MQSTEMLGQCLTDLAASKQTDLRSCCAHAPVAGKRDRGPRGAHLLGRRAVLPAHQWREALEEGPPARGAARRRSLLLRFSRPGRPFCSLRVCPCLPASHEVSWGESSEVHMFQIRPAQRFQVFAFPWGPAHQTASFAVCPMRGGGGNIENHELCTPGQEAGGWGPAGQAR